MRTLRSPLPGDDDPPTGANHDYAMWDAAYVLGSLSAADRREFEAHMHGCAPCRDAVAELSGVPALLSQLDRDELAAIDEADRNGGEPPLPEQLLASLLAKVRGRRRRSRMLAWSLSAAAAVVLVVAVLVGVLGHGPAAAPAPPQASATHLSMAQVGTTRLTSTVSLRGRQWGTVIDMTCVCLAPVYAHHDRLAMVVVGHDGSHTRLATWIAEPGRTATPVGSISMPADQIAAVQVVSANDGTVLLERSL